MVVRVAALGIAVHNQMLMSACEHVVKCEIASEWMLSTACELACESLVRMPWKAEAWVLDDNWNRLLTFVRLNLTEQVFTPRVYRLLR